MVTIRSLKKRFLKLSFKKKLVLAFTLSTFITLLITNIIMHVLLNYIGKQDNELISSENQQFNEVSTRQIIQSVAKVGLTALDRFSQILLQIVRAEYYFRDHPQMYTSLETTNPYFPPLTSSFTTFNFSAPAIYLLNPNSTFYNNSYLDVILSNIAKNRYPGIKRINIFYINADNSTGMLNDLMVRTLPGTDDFVIKNPQDIMNRMKGLKYDYYQIGTNYTDQLTKSDNPDSLMSIRTLMHGNIPNLHIVVQIEIYQAVLYNIIGSIYYFPSTNAFFIELINSTNINILSYLKPPSNNPQLLKSIKTPTGYIKLGLKNGTTVIMGSVGIDKYHKLGQFSQFSNSSDSTYRFVLVTDEKESSVPYKIMSNLIENQSFSILIILYTWGGFILLISAGLSIVVGNHVFHHLHFLANKLQQYIKTPSSLPSIISMLSELPIKGTIKRLIDSLISILTNIEDRKKKITEYKVEKHKFPLNICYRQFQQRTGMQDYIVMDQLYEQLCRRYPTQ